MTHRPSALLSEFADKLLSTVSESGKVIQLDTGRILFSQGDPGNNLYTVLSGQLRIYTRLELVAQQLFRRGANVVDQVVENGRQKTW